MRCRNCRRDAEPGRKYCADHLLYHARYAARRRQGRPPRAAEPTAEEVERTVAEQLRCLPAWWATEQAREDASR